MNQIVLAFRAFFALLFSGKLPDDIVSALGLGLKREPPKAAPAAPPAAPQIQPADGALQLLGMFQREARLLDFFMEDIAPFTDEQVGGAARDVHQKTHDLLIRHFAPAPLIDAVEGSIANAPSDPALVKFIGNLPATGAPASGVLRHRGWRAGAVSVPKWNPKQDLRILAQAEIEVE